METSQLGGSDPRDWKLWPLLAGGSMLPLRWTPFDPTTRCSLHRPTDPRPLQFRDRSLQRIRVQEPKREERNARSLGLASKVQSQTQKKNNTCLAAYRARLFLPGVWSLKVPRRTGTSTCFYRVMSYIGYFEGSSY